MVIKIVTNIKVKLMTLALVTVVTVVTDVKLIYLPDPRGAGLQEDFQLLSVCTSVQTYVSFGLVVSYSANIPQAPHIFTDSGPPIK